MCYNVANMKFKCVSYSAFILHIHIYIFSKDVALARPHFNDGNYEHSVSIWRSMRRGSDKRCVRKFLFELKCKFHKRGFQFEEEGELSNKRTNTMLFN